MGKFDVHIFIIHCFIPSLIDVASNISIRPFGGIGIVDTADLIDEYLRTVLNQPVQPIYQKSVMSDTIRQEGASAVILVRDIEAIDHSSAIEKTRPITLMCRDVLALRQMQRGIIGGFLSMRTDSDPYELFSGVRRPYALLRKIQNIPIGETEGDIIVRILSKASRYPLLKVYLALYADAMSYSDSLITDVTIETKLFKIWSLLESMASSETGNKKQKVKALFNRYNLSSTPDYKGHIGRDLIDVAYSWRNIIAHCGGCQATTSVEDSKFCTDYASYFSEIMEDLSQICRLLLHAYANRLPNI